MVPRNRRQTTAAGKKCQTMVQKLQETFVLWPSKIERLQKILDDQEFMRSMKSDWKVSFADHDKKCAKKIERNFEHEETAARRKENSQEKFYTETEMSLSEESNEHMTDQPSISLLRSHH